MTRPLRLIGVLVPVVLCVLALAPSTAAQIPPVASNSYDEPPAHVSFVEGTAVLERDGEADDAPLNMPLVAGDRLRTGSGRVEVMFADGGTLHLDGNTVVDLESDVLIRLLQGRVRLSIAAPSSSQIDYRIDTPSATAFIYAAGAYRVSVSPRGDVDLAVLRGAAELANDRGRRDLRSGEQAFVRSGEAPSYPYVFNSAAWDDFDRWCEGRRDARLGLSTRYLPEDVRVYASSFDRYGTWRYDNSYGYVWYPTVSVGWRPYYYGRWSPIPTYGWTWIGHDPWAWPTHHYGRWGISAGLWFWIPGAQWSTAWVSWAYAPGYVSWCPLGWDNHAVVGFVGVNAYHGGYSPWRAWTVLPQQHFGRGSVAPRALRPELMDARARGAFVQRDAPPAFSGYAQPRAAAPIHVAGTAVPRGTGAPNASRGAQASRDAAYGTRSPQAPSYTGRASQARPVMPQPGAGTSPQAVPAQRVPAFGAQGSGSRIYRVPDYAPSKSPPAPRAVERYNPGYPATSGRVMPGGEVPSQRTMPAGDARTPSPDRYQGHRYQPADGAPAYNRPLPPQAVPRQVPRQQAEPAAPGYSRPPRAEAAPGPAGPRAVPRGEGSAPPQRTAPQGHPRGGRSGG